MKKILGLIASQRKLANGEILVKEAANGVGEEHQLELIRLTDLNLKPCLGCYSCLTPGKRCSLGDDLYFLTDKIKEADGIILAAPCYALGPAAVVKLFGDRIIALAQMIDDFYGKPCIVIATAGIVGCEGYTLTALNNVARFMGLALKDSHMFMAALPGEVTEDAGALARVREMGKALFGEARQPRQGECPTCWSELWKFPQPGSAVCPICGQTACLITEEGGVVWEFGSPSNKFDKQNIIAHLQVWLRGKREEYIARRNEIGEIRKRYKGQDIWLLPTRE